MSPLFNFLIQALILSSVFIYFAFLKTTRNSATNFLIYLGILFTLGGFFGAVYTLPLTATISISGGSLLYAAFMMGAILLFVIENDLSVFRTLTHLVVIISIFKFLLFTSLGIILNTPTTINSFNTAPEIFSVSSKFIFIGAFLIVAELFLFHFLFGKVKKWMHSPMMISLAFSVIYILVLCLDGVLFPLFAFPISPQLIGIITGNVATKFVLSLPFALLILIFSIVFQGKMANFASRKFIIKDLFAKPREILIQDIVEKNSALEIQRNNYYALANSLGDMFFSYDSRGRISFWNNACQQATGLTEDQAIGKDFKAVAVGVLADIFSNNSDGGLELVSGQFAVERHDQTLHFDVSTNSYANGSSVIVRNISPLIQAHEDIQSTHNFYNAIIENAPVSIYVISKDHRIRLVNHKWEDERKLSRKEAIGASLADLFPKVLSDHFIANDQKVFNTKSSLVFEEQTEDPDGTHHYQTIKFPVFNNAGEIEAVGGISVDITLLKMKEQGILRLSRMNAIQCQINQTIVQTKNQQDLFDHICRIFVDYGQYKLAWVGEIQLDQSINPVSHFGDQGYINYLNVTTKNEPAGQGPAGIAARENRIVAVNNIQKDPRMQPWWEVASRFGYQSVAAIPLHCQKAVIGIFVVYSGDYQFLNDDEIKLLKEIGIDIDFALDNFELEKNRCHFEHLLVESEAKYRALVETSHDLIWSTDADWRITYINRASKEIYGYEPEEMIGHLYQEFTTQEQFEKNEEINRAILAATDENFGYVNMMLRKDGEKVIISANSIAQRDQQGNILGSSGISRDITNLVHANIERERYANQLDALAQLGLRINQANTIDEILTISVRKSAEILNSRMCLFSFTKSDGFSQKIHTYYLSDDYEPNFDWNPLLKNSEETGIYRQVCETSQPMRLTKDELLQHPAWTNYGGASGHRVPSSGRLVVPLLTNDGRNMGLIQLSDKVEGEFNENDLSILVQISQFISVSIQKLNLLQQLGDAKEKLRFLAKEILNAQDNERRRISRELHDDSGQSLTALKINLQMLAEDVDQANPLLVPQISECIHLTEEIFTKIRNLSHMLHPPQIDSIGMNASLEGLCIVHAKQTRMEIIYHGLDLTEVSGQIKTTLYRFLQEALTNISKHSRASQVLVNLNQDAEHILLQVKDNGIGIAEEIINDIQKSKGLGLRSMKERLELMDGHLLVKVDKGTILTAVIPARE